jgi:hypothetical protein
VIPSSVSILTIAELRKPIHACEKQVSVSTGAFKACTRTSVIFIASSPQKPTKPRRKKQVPAGVEQQFRFQNENHKKCGFYESLFQQPIYNFTPIRNFGAFAA